MRKKIFRSEIAVAMAVLLVSLLVAGSFLYGYFNKTQSVQLKEELNLVSGIVDKYGEDYLKKPDSDVFRFTLIQPDGTVIFDTKAEPNEMDNHLDREEVKEALVNGQAAAHDTHRRLPKKTFTKRSDSETETFCVSVFHKYQSAHWQPKCFRQSWRLS